MSVRVTGIRKDSGNHQNPHEGITDYQWVNEHTRATGISSRLEMILFFERDRGEAYVKDYLGNIAYIGVQTSAWGTKYLRTYANGKWSDNLLSLPEI
jgi:hypothetical protein